MTAGTAQGFSATAMAANMGACLLLVAWLLAAAGWLWRLGGVPARR